MVSQVSIRLRILKVQLAASLGVKASGFTGVDPFEDTESYLLAHRSNSPFRFTGVDPFEDTERPVSY